MYGPKAAPDTMSNQSLTVNLVTAGVTRRASLCSTSDVSWCHCKPTAHQAELGGDAEHLNAFKKNNSLKTNFVSAQLRVK